MARSETNSSAEARASASPEAEEEGGVSMAFEGEGASFEFESEDEGEVEGEAPGFEAREERTAGSNLRMSTRIHHSYTLHPVCCVFAVCLLGLGTCIARHVRPRDGLTTVGAERRRGRRRRRRNVCTPHTTHRNEA